MKVAVTGAAGFIGCHVLAELETKLIESSALVWHSAAKALVLAVQLNDPDPKNLTI